MKRTEAAAMWARIAAGDTAADCQVFIREVAADMAEAARLKAETGRRAAIVKAARLDGLPGRRAALKEFIAEVQAAQTPMDLRPPVNLTAPAANPAKRRKTAPTGAEVDFLVGALANFRLDQAVEIPTHEAGPSEAIREARRAIEKKAKK